ncbi:cellulose binding domain-containing protein [Spirillospora sp. NPDC048911]|uniref:cellulose binding domain-containing protein n=1 Tax=Spirillospora sp. NPDC048911 TaxID=3364527 RepID=UPI003721C251
MSGQEPGYVPPDHKTTAEFGIPGDAAPAESTIVDQPVDDPEVTQEDVPEDDAPPATVTDFSLGEPATVTDLAVDEPATVTDFAADQVDVPVAGGAAPPSVVEEATAPRAVNEQPPVANEQPPPVPDEHDLWTAQFGAEEETAPGEAAPPSAAAPPFLAPPTPDVHQQPAAAFQQPAAAPPQQPNVPPQQPFASPSGGVPPQQSTPPPMPGMPMPQRPPARGKSRRPVILVAVGAAVIVLGAAAAGAVLLLQDGGSEKTDAAKPAPSATPSASATPSGTAAATPTPTGSGAAQPTPPAQQTPAPVAPTPTAPPVGPVVSGNGITYQLMQQDPGYYEGRMVFTNRGDKPMRSWKITFDAPNANVKNIWGGRLVRKGDRVEIQNLKGAPPVPPGATWEIQYGAAGAAANPKGCKINGTACGF